MLGKQVLILSRARALSNCARPVHRNNDTRGYGSAKGGLALFLQGLRGRLYPAGVRVITTKPGPVRTPMTDPLPNRTRFADPRRVARDIVRALAGRSPDILYTPAIWRYIMLLVRLIPESIFKRLPSF